MFLLDANVLSEVMRPHPARLVLDWLDTRIVEEVWVCLVSRAEIALGIELLPAGQKKRGLQQAAMCMFEEEFSGRSLPFDDRAADQYAVIVKQRRSQGLPINVEDAQIAAIAPFHQLVLVTRNASDFTGIDGLVVNNPLGLGIGPQNKDLIASM